MYSKGLLKKVIVFILATAILFTGVPGKQSVYAANLRFYNYNTGSNVNYSDKQIIYTYNGRELPLTYPGILINGTALADYEDLFVKELGLQASIDDKTISFSDGTTNVILTVGSKKASINGVSKTISVAPVKLKFDDTIKYYVPTRFVAEAFGFEYTWVSNISTVRITKNLNLTINQKEITYNGSFYSVKTGEHTLELTLPVIYYNGTVFAPAKDVFEAVGCTYKEDSSIQIQKGNIYLEQELFSKNAFVNDTKFIMEASPMQVSDTALGLCKTYIPLEFSAEMLGFSLTYDDALKCYTLLETENTGKAELNPKLKPKTQKTKLPEKNMEEQQPLKTYFEWNAEETAAVYGQKYLSKVKAYALENADVIELYGITRADINDFIDSGLLIFELKSVITNMDTQYFSDFSLSHLTYALLTSLSNNTKLFFMIPIEDEWHFIEKEDCVQVYFMNADLSLEDLSISSVKTSIEEPVEYPDDVLVIPMPKKIDISQLKDQDNYLKKNFQISLPGNHVEFFEQNNILNPYSYVSNVEFSYNSEADYTVISCYTKNVCAYEYTLEHGYLAVNVARPNEIYDKIIVLDAGHGGKDPGATRNGINEKDINYTIINTYLKDFFENSGIKVYYTRETDVYVSLNNRAKLASETGADLFISLHMNASTLDNVSGTEVYYSSSNNKKLSNGLRSSIVAKKLVNNLCAAIGTSNRGILNSDYYVVKYNSVPAVLIELGFISSQKDLSKLTNATYQKKAAKAIYETVLELFAEYPVER